MGPAEVPYAIDFTDSNVPTYEVEGGGNHLKVNGDDRSGSGRIAAAVKLEQPGAPPWRASPTRRPGGPGRPFPPRRPPNQPGARPGRHPPAQPHPGGRGLTLSATRTARGSSA